MRTVDLMRSLLCVALVAAISVPALKLAFAASK